MNAPRRLTPRGDSPNVAADREGECAILVVEDEAALSDALGRGLRHAAHAVDVAPTLAAARSKAGAGEL